MYLLDDGNVRVQRVLDGELKSGPGASHIPVVDHLFAQLLRVVSVWNAQV